MPLTRRRLLQLSALGTGGLLLPHRLHAGVPGSSRRFLFVFATGGWDQCFSFAPLFDSPDVDMEADAVEATVNGITFVDAENRPNVRAFYETWGQDTVLVNGLESRSVAHDVCLRLMMTGTQQIAADDWAVTSASQATDSPLLPMIHRSGPSYAYTHGSSVVRIGSADQLTRLLDGTAMDASDLQVRLPSAELDLLQDAYAAEVAARRHAAASRGRALELLSKATESEARLAALQVLAGDLDLSAGDGLQTTLATLADIFELGLSRTALVAYDGLMSLGWDTHSNNSIQAEHFNDLFGTLDALMQDLNQRPGTAGGTLADETTVVVLSEMGRYPQLNSEQGKEHWTYTSALLIGAGLQGGQTIGGYDAYCGGRPVDPVSGQVDETHGVMLLPNNVGSTLLRLAGLDDQEFRPGFSALESALADG
jgi:hypothetical protein